MLPAARAAINEAIRLDPMQADYFSWLAAFLYDSGQWKAALKAADQGLELNALHVSCANLRALSLAKLGRQAEAKATSLAALARDPVNAVSHAIQATTLMRQADYGQARANYMEALRLDPLCEWAHRGRVYARWGSLFTTAPRTIGRAVLELLRRPIPRLGGVSDKKAAWVGCIVFVALNAAATGLVDRNWVTGLYTMAYGLAALLLIGMGSLVRGFLTGVAWGLSFCIAVPFFVEILVVSELVHPTNPEARLLNQVAYVLSGVAVLGVLSFVFGIMQAGMLADLSLPRRKPEQPPASGPDRNLGKRQQTR